MYAILAIFTGKKTLNIQTRWKRREDIEIAEPAATSNAEIPKRNYVGIYDSTLSARKISSTGKTGISSVKK